MSSPIDYIINSKLPDKILSVQSQDNQGSNITFYSKTTEMLRVAEDGFYVRGKKLDVDDKEAAAVYRAFKEFLIWSALHR